jgi:hypothetical protein
MRLGLQCLQCFCASCLKSSQVKIADGVWLHEAELQHGTAVMGLTHHLAHAPCMLLPTYLAVLHFSHSRKAVTPHLQKVLIMMKITTWAGSLVLRPQGIAIGAVYSAAESIAAINKAREDVSARLPTFGYLSTPRLPVFPWGAGIHLQQSPPQSPRPPKVLEDMIALPPTHPFLGCWCVC